VERGIARKKERQPHAVLPTAALRQRLHSPSLAMML
jgi:hypothetical protein